MRGKSDTCAEIISAVAAVYGLRRDQIVLHSKARPFIEARHVAFWLCRHVAGRKFTVVARLFGNRHHSTVMHGCARVEADLARLRDPIVRVCSMLGVAVPDSVVVQA